VKPAAFGPTPDEPSAGLQHAWRDYTAIVGGQAASLALGLLGVVLATRLLGPGGYGRVALLLAVLQLLYVVVVHWTMPAVVRFGREDLLRNAPGGRVLGSWLMVAGSASLTAMTFALWMPTPLRDFAGLQAGEETLVPVLLVAVAAAGGAEQLLQMTGRMGAYAAGRALGKLAFCFGLTVLVLLGSGQGRVDRVVLLMAGGFAVQALAALAFLPPSLLSSISVDLRLVRRMLLYSAPLVARSAAGYALDWIDVYWLRVFRSIAEVGVYHVAYRWMTVVAELLAALTILTFPLLTGWRAVGSEASVRRYFDRVVPQLSVAWSLFVAGLGLGGAFIPAILGPGFHEVSRLFSVLLVAAAFQLAIYAYLPLFSSHDLLGRATLIVLPMLLLNLLADLLLIPRLGAIGGAIATALTYAAGAGLHVLAGNRPLGLRQASALVPPCLAAAALGVQGLGVPLAVQGAAFLLAATALLAWCKVRGIFAPGDLALLDRIGLPRPLRSAIGRAFAILS